MKKIVLLVLLSSAMLFSQGITEKLKWEKVFDIAADSKNVVNWKARGLVASDSADMRLAENEAEIIRLLSGKIIESEKPIEPEVVEELTPEAQAVIDYLKAISSHGDVLLEKPDTQELYQSWIDPGSFSPVQTNLIWRNDTIKKWMDLNGCFYYKSWAKAKLIEAVRGCVE